MHPISIVALGLLVVSPTFAATLRLDDVLHSGTIFGDVVIDDGAQITVAMTNNILQNVTLVSEAYEKYKTAYKKPQSIASEIRVMIFQNTLSNIFNHNLLFRSGQSSYEMGVNQFSDMTFEEFSAQYLKNGNVGWGNLTNVVGQQKTVPSTTTPSILAVPADIDYRALGHVTPVKNQGGCGSCILFAAVGTLESSHSLWHNRQHLDLSEQELVDCSRGGGGNCGGFNGDVTWNYMRDKGLGLERDYPYEARVGACRSAGKPKVARSTGWWNIRPQRDENRLKECVALYGPVAVALHVNSAFQSYRSGIFEGPCTGSRNHAGVVVGYNGERGRDFWLFKNSWGPGWGEQGYIRIRRNYGNLCDIAGDAAFLAAA